MKLYKDYTKELFSLLVNDTTLSSDNPLRFIKWVLVRKSSQSITKLKKKKTQYNLDGQTTRIFALTSRNVIKILNMSF